MGVSVIVAAREPLRRVIEEALTGRGHMVSKTCTSLADTLAAVRRSHPDVCVIDRELPGGALAAIAALTGPQRQPRVIVIGGESPAEVRAVRLAGAAVCLPATVDPEELAAAVAAAAGRERGEEKR
jgi:DNA-binding NarL/FixJ family response regulator